MNDLKQLSSTALVSEIQSIRTTERETVAEIIRYLEEIDSRQYYRDLGYSSLFTFCTGCLGYSESSAGRRVAVARALRVDERVYQLIKTGEVSLCSVALISKELVKNKDKGLLTKIIGKSKSEVEDILWTRLTPTKPAVRKSTVRRVKKKIMVSESADDPLFNQLPTVGAPETEPEVEYSLTLKVDQEFMDLLAEVKELSGKAGFDDVESLKRAMSDFIEHKSPVKKQERRIKRKKQRELNTSKALSTVVKDQVYIRDGGRCTYVAKDGTRCSCRKSLEFDHKTPKALGGDNSVENIRLLCRAHNLLMAEKAFGREYIKQFSGSVQ